MAILLLIVSNLFLFLGSNPKAYAEGSLAADVQKFIVKYDEYSLGSVDIIHGTTSQYIKPEQVFDILKLGYKEDAQKGSISVVLPSSDEEILYYPQSKKIILSGEEITLNPFEYKEFDGQIYIEINNFIKLFDIDFTIHLDVQEIIISSGQEFTFLDNYLRNGAAALSAGGEDNNGSGKVAPIAEAPLDGDVELIGAEQGIQSFTEVEGKDFPAVTPDNYNEDNLLIFEIGIDDQVFDQLVDVYEHQLDDGSTAIYVSLSQFVENLEFDINVDLENRKAKGWFIREDSTMDIDFDRNKMRLNGHDVKLVPQDYVVTEDDIFFLVSNLKIWFPIDYEVKYNSQRLQIFPRILLPFQEKKIREVKRKKLLGFKKRKQYPLISTPYQSYQVPEMDVSISTQISDRDDEKPEGDASYSVSLTGDYGGFNTSSYISGDYKEWNSFRVSGERKDLEGNIFNGGISEFSFGDISSYSVPLVSGSDNGVGALVSTYPLTRSAEFDKTVIEGDIKPNWEVELYRNSQLVSFQISGQDGRYKFEDVDVLYGDNVFKLVFYGPQGEIKEEIKEIFIDHNILKKGEYNYKISANRKGDNLFKVKSDNARKSNRVVMQGEYGFAENFTLSSTVVVDEFYNKFNQKDSYIFQQMQFTREMLGGIANLNLAYNYQDNGFAVRQTYVSRFFDTNVNFRQEFYENYINQSRVTDNDPLQMKSSVSVNRSVNISNLKNSNITLDADYSNFDSGKSQMQLSGGFSTVYKGYSLSNNVSGRFDNAGNESSSGSFSLRANYDKGFNKIDAKYSISPTATLDSISFSTQRTLGQKTSARLDVTQPLSSNNITSFGASLNYTNKNYIMSVNGSLDSNANYNIGVNFSFSLYENSQGDFEATSNISAESGSVLAYAFIDDNMNGAYDESSEDLIGEAVFKRGSKELARTSDGRYAYSRNIPPYNPVEIYLDSSSLDDPLWYPVKKGYSVVSRAGIVTSLPFPVARTVEVDGTIYLEGAVGEDGTVSGMTVYLIDGEGKRVSEAISEYDGYFMFEKVVAGRYFIVASDNQLRDLGLQQSYKPEINIDHSDDYYPDNDITLINLGSSDSLETGNASD